MAGRKSRRLAGVHAVDAFIGPGGISGLKKERQGLPTGDGQDTGGRYQGRMGCGLRRLFALSLLRFSRLPGPLPGIPAGADGTDIGLRGAIRPDFLIQSIIQKNGRVVKTCPALAHCSSTHPSRLAA